ncbi:MAG: hypothetical protein QM656_01590 [Paracoccaceae bacterium]
MKNSDARSEARGCPASEGPARPVGAAGGSPLETSSKERLRRTIRCVFLEGQHLIDRELRGGRQRWHSRTEGLAVAEYEVLFGLTDQAIADGRQISLRTVRGRLQQRCGKPGLTELPVLASGTAR